MAVNMTLNDIAEELKDAQESELRQEEHLKIISRFFIEWSRGKFDRSEAAYEAKPSTPTMYEQGLKAGQDFDLLNLLGLGTGLSALVASLGALSGALGGLRGWETAALGQVKKLGDRLKNVFKPITAIGDDLADAVKAGGFRSLASNLITKITTGVDDLTRSILKGFGVDPETGKMARDAKTGRFTGKEMKSTLQMMDEASGGLITRLTNGFDRVMGSIRAAGNAFDTYIAGPGAKLFGFIDGVLGISQGVADAGKFLKVMGRLLWPLGVFMSALDGIEAYKNTEGSAWDKFSAGISAFVGDFLGAPLDLLKSGLAWVLGKFGWNEEAEQIKAFNIEEKITNLIQGVLDFPEKAFEWIKSLFADPVPALKELWQGVMGSVDGAVGAATTLLDIVWWPVNQFIDWVTKKLGWRSEDAPTFNLREEITGWVSDFWSWFTGWLPDISKIAADLTEKIKAYLPDWLVDNVDLEYKNTGVDRNRTRMMENEDAVMSQQVIGGPQKTYNTRADIAQALSFDWNAYKAMNEGANPYQQQLNTAPVIVQDNSTSNGGSVATLNMSTELSTTDTAYYNRRVAMGLGF